VVQINRNTRFLLVTATLAVVAAYAGSAAAFCAWITADPPVAVANGRSRPHTLAELEFARNWATIWFVVFVAAAAAIALTVARWWRGRSLLVV
jgi:hypothetical protein